MIKMALVAVLALTGQAWGFSNIGGGGAGGSGGGAPTGAASGDLSGTYPGPSVGPSIAGLVILKSSATAQADFQAPGSSQTFTAAFNVSLSTAGPLVFVQLTGNVTSSQFNQPLDRGMYNLIICQDSVGSRTFTWPASMVWPGGGSAPTLTTTASKCDFFAMRYLSFDSKFHVLAEALNN